MLLSSIREPAQASALAELRQSISSSLDGLNQKVEAVQNVCTVTMQFPNIKPDPLDSQLTHINTQALQTIKDQQLQILTAIVPLLPMLQKVPLHIASAEASLKEAIRNSAVAPTVVSTQLTNASPISGSRKRKLSKNHEQHTPSPSVTRRRRIYVDSGSTAQQLPSPKSSRDSLLTQGGLSTANQHRPIGDAPRPDSGSVSRTIDSTKTPNPGQRSSMQPPTPRIVPSTPSRAHSVALPDRTTQPTSSTLSHKKEVASEASVAPHSARPVSNVNSVTPAPPNRLSHLKDAFKAPNPFYIHTPLRTASKHPSDWSKRPSAPRTSSIGFSAVRSRLAHKPLSVPHLLCPSLLPLLSDEENASFQSLMTTTTTKFSVIDARETVQCFSIPFPHAPESLFDFSLVAFLVCPFHSTFV